MVRGCQKGEQLLHSPSEEDEKRLLHYSRDERERQVEERFEAVRSNPDVGHERNVDDTFDGEYGNPAILLDFVIDASLSSIKQAVVPVDLRFPLPDLPSAAGDGRLDEQVSSVVIAIGVDSVTMAQVLLEHQTEIKVNVARINHQEVKQLPTFSFETARNQAPVSA